MSPDFGSLINLLDEKLESIKSQVKRGPSLIYADETADGIAAGAISFDLLKRIGTKPTVRFVGIGATSAGMPEFSADVRIGIGLKAGTEENVINLGINGEIFAEGFGFKASDASLSTLAHLLRNREFKSPSTHYLAIAGSISSLMDSGDFRELTGLNEAVLEEGIAMGVLGSERRIDLGFGYILPLHSAISASVDPYFKGITGNMQASESVLNDNGIPLKSEDRYLTLKDLNDDLLGQLAMVLDKHSESGPVRRSVYYQNNADESFFTWNIRDLSLMLELLIASGSTLLAFKLASGAASFSDYDAAWRTSMAQLRSTIDSTNRILTNRERVIDDGNVKRINANGVLNFKESLMVMKWLSRWKGNRERMIVLETSQGTDELFLMKPDSEEVVKNVEEVGEYYGARIKFIHPFLLVFVNVIKAGQFYESFRSRAGVP
ncbi:MAG: hypothetical protein JRN26_00280 [Nitrososphaerota archaeon]|nr:hypothetical protein [Nitrososphaerota archaeon]MDG6928136.1 hypothetical protein [Nitrososphaerota archaeon]MDG6930975.1 hypothetical protein [Nitrososphaerota archaeon]MDG6932799.1 hypothetical protein [Nitrososphaerota archaeon]MDG6935318.1 hypothetical protein [Nitrososphaerota archaeon]